MHQLAPPTKVKTLAAHHPMRKFAALAIAVLTLFLVPSRRLMAAQSGLISFTAAGGNFTFARGTWQLGHPTQEASTDWDYTPDQDFTRPFVRLRGVLFLNSLTAASARLEIRYGFTSMIPTQAAPRFNLLHLETFTLHGSGSDPNNVANHLTIDSSFTDPNLRAVEIRVFSPPEATNPVFTKRILCPKVSRETSFAPGPGVIFGWPEPSDILRGNGTIRITFKDPEGVAPSPLKGTVSGKLFLFAGSTDPGRIQITWLDKSDHTLFTVSRDVSAPGPRFLPISETYSDKLLFGIKIEVGRVVGGTFSNPQTYFIRLGGTVQNLALRPAGWVARLTIPSSPRIGEGWPGPEPGFDRRSNSAVAANQKQAPHPRPHLRS